MNMRNYDEDIFVVLKIMKKVLYFMFDRVCKFVWNKVRMKFLLNGCVSRRMELDRVRVIRKILEVRWVNFLVCMMIIVKVFFVNFSISNRGRRK